MPKEKVREAGRKGGSSTRMKFREVAPAMIFSGYKFFMFLYQNISITFGN